MSIGRKTSPTNEDLQMWARSRTAVDRLTHEVPMTPGSEAAPVFSRPRDKRREAAACAGPACCLHPEGPAPQQPALLRDSARIFKRIRARVSGLRGAECCQHRQSALCLGRDAVPYDSLGHERRQDGVYISKVSEAGGGCQVWTGTVTVVSADDVRQLVD